jgi:RNA polymerase sigma-70 factor, ECF subfamily
MLDVPAGTVKSRCARGRARLAEMLLHLDPAGRNPETDPPIQPEESRGQSRPGGTTDEEERA